ncbi:MAG: response regulator [Verrucomicrobia bacterium]|nr:response regulator [Verrucomicrobiota bacterium]
MTAVAVKPDILVIDDEIQIRRLLRLTLEGAGYRVREAETGALGLNEIAVQRPDAVILDLSLPDLAGLDILRRVREWSQIPVLILSVRDGEAEKIAALDAGADDYLTKPFGGGELLARLRVLLRRALPANGATVVQFGDVEVDFAKRTVTRAGTDLHLTVKEYALLRLLLQHRGKVVTHRQILREVWGAAHEADTHYLRVHMVALRKKIEPTPQQPRFLKTESGVGYRFAEE